MKNSPNKSIIQLILRGWLIVNVPIFTIILVIYFGLPKLFNANNVLSMFIGTLAGWYYWTIAIKKWINWGIDNHTTPEDILLAGRLGILLWTKQTIKIALGECKRKIFMPVMSVILLFILLIGGLILQYGSSNLYSKYYLSQATFSHKTSNFNDAIINYTKALEYNPKNVLAIISRGSAYFDLDSFENAYSDYNKAIEIDPYNANAYAYRGQTSYHLKNYNKALNDYNTAIHLDNKLGYAYYYRGFLYQVIYNNSTMSCSDLKQALKLGYTPAKSLLESSNCW